MRAVMIDGLLFKWIDRQIESRSHYYNSVLGFKLIW